MNNLAISRRQHLTQDAAFFQLCFCNGFQKICTITFQSPQNRNLKANTVKSSVEEIRQRFDADVERFSNLETGQTATIDARLAMDLVIQAAASATPHAQKVLDIGCGAGNYTLKLLEQLPDRDATLIDLSRPMLDRAVERISAVSRGQIETIQGDIREIELGENQHDLVFAAAVLHHLRTEDEWCAVFQKLFSTLRSGGSFWIFDLIESNILAVQQLMWKRYGDYLTEFKGEEYRDHVFAYIEQEDTPRSLMWQLDLLKKVGFQQVEILHKNGCFAAYGAIK